MARQCVCPKRWQRARTSYENWYRVCGDWSQHVYARKPGRVVITVSRGARTVWQGEHGDVAKAKRTATRVLRYLCGRR